MKLSIKKFQGINVMLKAQKKQKMPDKCVKCKDLCDNITYCWCGNKAKDCKDT